MVIRSVSVVAIIFTTAPKPVRVVLVVVFVVPLMIRCALEFAAAARTAQEEDDDDDVILDADDAPNWLKLLSIDVMNTFQRNATKNRKAKVKTFS
jgi:hypothetical protein